MIPVSRIAWFESFMFALKEDDGPVVLSPFVIAILPENIVESSPSKSGCGAGWPILGESKVKVPIGGNELRRELKKLSLS